MDATQIKNPSTFKVWQKSQAREVAICLALRSALRVAPIWFSAAGLAWPKQLDMGALEVLRVLIAARVYVFRPTRYTKDHLNSALQGTKIKSSPLLIVGEVNGFPMGSSGMTTHIHHPGVQAAFAANAINWPEMAIGSAAEAAEDFANVGEMIWEQVREDARLVEAGGDPLLEPLWSIPQPGWFQVADTSARQVWLNDQPENWDFWGRWWNGIISGRHIDLALQERVAQIDDAIWKQGPAAVATAIREIETEVALAASDNAERIEVNPATGRLRLVPDSDLSPDFGQYIRRKMAKARALFPARDVLAQHYVAIQPELDLIDEALADASNLPVELYDTCASVHRRVSQRAHTGECPAEDQDPQIADFLHRMRDIGADILGNDPKAQMAIDNRNAILGNSALIDARGPLLAYAEEVAKVSEGRLGQLAHLAEEATNPLALPDDRKVASVKLGGRVIRVATLVKAAGGVAIAGGGAFLTIEGLANSPWASAAFQATLRYFGFG